MRSDHDERSRAIYAVARSSGERRRAPETSLDAGIAREHWSVPSPPRESMIDAAEEKEHREVVAELFRELRAKRGFTLA